MRCARCRDQLKAGTTFCIGCGFDNGQSAVGKDKLKIDSQLERKAAKRGFWRKLTSFMFFFRRM